MMRPFASMPALARRSQFVAMLSLAAIAMLLAPALASADTFFSTGTSQTLSTSLPGNVIVQDNPLAHTASTLVITSGGSVGNDLDVYGSSGARINNGVVNGNANLYNASTLSMSQGSVGGNVNAYNTASVNISGGMVGGNLNALGSNSIHITNGFIGGTLDAGGASQVTIIGGEINNVQAGSGTQLLMKGGQIDGNLATTGLATITGGKFLGDLVFTGNAAVTLSGGHIGGIVSDGGASTLTVIGTNLQYVGGELTGRLTDGTPIDVFPLDLNAGQLILQSATVPEPGSLSLIIIAACAGGFFRLRSTRRISAR